MKRYAKLIQADKRGQIVIPKDVRDALSMTEETGFYVYLIPGEGVLLKRVDPAPLDEDPAMQRLQQHAEALGIPLDALKKTLDEYKRDGGLL